MIQMKNQRKSRPIDICTACTVHMYMYMYRLCIHVEFHVHTLSLSTEMKWFERTEKALQTSLRDGENKKN